VYHSTQRQKVVPAGLGIRAGKLSISSKICPDLSLKNIWHADVTYLVKAVTIPDPTGSFKPENCPICWDDVEDSKKWRVFGCGHGTCVVCYSTLVNPAGPSSNCPLCRTPLVTCIAPGTPLLQKIPCPVGAMNIFH
jgi:hypothetical protein